MRVLSVSKTVFGLLVGLPVLTACYSVTPTPEPMGLSSPGIVLRHDGQVVAQANDHLLPDNAYKCPAGHWLAKNKVVVLGGFPASFDLEIESAPGLVAAEVSVAGGTLTRLSPGAVRSSSVRDGQTVEIARMPLSGGEIGRENLRFSVIPVTGTRLGGPETVSVYTRVINDTGGAEVLGAITAGSEARLCGPY
ncbi:MAG: hypothetical protein AAGH41_05710 [Pseudomonadota bacterium]